MSISDLDANIPGDDAPAGEGAARIRDINAALKEAFGAVDNVITNTGATQNVGDTDPPDAATWSQLFADVRTLASGAAAGGTVQLGMCMLWNTAVGAIPTGWTACNGININNVPVPNLIDRFVMGAGNKYTNGQVGGAEPGTQVTDMANAHVHTTSGHTLTVAELPRALSDNVNILQSPSYTDTTARLTFTETVSRGSSATGANSTQPMSITGLGDDAHSHGDTGVVEGHVHTLSDGALPPFQALTWICFVGVAA